MKVFDQIDARDLEHRELHLWMLTTTILVVLIVGLALLMYPAVFSHALTLSAKTLRITFFGFCALGALLIGYLIDRQVMISHLRKAIAHEQKRSAEIRCQASKDILDSLSGLNHFQDRLAMEYRRAVNLAGPLSILVIEVKPTDASVSVDGMALTETLGDAVKTVTRKLRKDDSIYHFCTNMFGVILPGIGLAEATQYVSRIEEGLQDAAGASGRFFASINVLNFPDRAATARELLQGVRSLLPTGLLGEPELDADLLVAPQ